MVESKSELRITVEVTNKNLKLLFNLFWKMLFFMKMDSVSKIGKKSDLLIYS